MVRRRLRDVAPGSSLASFAVVKRFSAPRKRGEGWTSAKRAERLKHGPEGASVANHPVALSLGCRIIADGLTCGGLSTSCRRSSHFSLVAQRKVTKRKSTPMARLTGILPSRCAGGFRGFSTGLPALAKNWPASCRPLCELSSTHPPRHRGPGKSSARPARTF